MRLDKYLQQYIAKKYKQVVSRNFVSSLIGKGLFSVKGMVVKKKSFLMLPEMVVEYDYVELQKQIKAYFGLQTENVVFEQWHRSESPLQIGEDLSSAVSLSKNQIKLENKDYLIVYKPAGVYSHPGRGSNGNDIVTQTLMYLQEQGFYSYRDLPRGGLVHRLDRATRGLLIFAKHRQAYNYFRTLFDDHTITKYYWAECDVTAKGNEFIKRQQWKVLSAEPLGQQNKAVLQELMGEKQLLLENAVEVEGYTWRFRGDHRQMVFSFRDNVLKKSKQSCSTFWLFSRQNDRVQLLIQIHTGRTHQIRTQCRAMGLPIRNDPLYGQFKATKNVKVNDVRVHAKDVDLQTDMQLVAFWLSFLYESKPVIAECFAEL